MNSKLLAVLLSSLFTVACGGEAPATGGNGANTGSGDTNEHGTPHTLGDITIASFKITVIQSGDVEAGKEAFFDLEFAEGTSMPGTVRGWVGIETGIGSRKGKFDKMASEMHGHIDVPDPIPDGSKLWIEIEQDTGPQAGSIALHQ